MSPAAVALSEPVFELPRVWAGIAQQAPVLAETVTGYLDDLSARPAPRSVAAAEVCLRDFSLHVLATNRYCRAARDISASQVAAWCAELAERAVTAETINYKLDVLRRFFEHLRGSGHPDAPAEIPIACRPRPPRPSRPLRPFTKQSVREPKAAKQARVPKPTPPSRALPPETTWEEIALRAPQLVATMTAYLEQITVSHRPASVVAYSLALRHLAASVTATDPNCVTVADISRTHIAEFKLAFATRPGLRGAMSTTTIRHNLGMIRTFFERIIDWDWDDAPGGCRSSPGTFPKPTSRCRSSWTTRPRRSSWPPWPPTPTGAADYSWSCWLAPG